jgi:hypothetical protein
VDKTLDNQPKDQQSAVQVQQPREDFRKKKEDSGDICEPWRGSTRKVGRREDGGQKKFLAIS